MKVCFFGLGSIGQRHARNLLITCKARGVDLMIDAFRQTQGPLPDDVAQVVNVVRDPQQLSEKYDAVFITNPTNQHYRTLLENAGRSAYFFVEKPLFEQRQRLPLPSESIYVACPLRYSGTIERLAPLIKQERVFSAVATCSSYLPDWRKADYRQSYSAHKEMGGGVNIDLIHELDYLCYLFGKPMHVHLEMGKFSALEIDSADTAVYQLAYPDKLALIYLDYFGVYAQRDVVLRTESTVIYADFLRNTLEIKRRDGDDELIRWDENPNDKYLREMERFFDWTQGKAYNHNEGDLANEILALAMGE